MAQADQDAATQSVEPVADHDPADDIPDSEYPGTLRLTAILVSLMLSIFLVSPHVGKLS